MAAIGALGKFNEFWRVVRDLNPQAVNRDIERGFSLALLGSDLEGKRAVRQALRPADGERSERYLIEVVEDLNGRAPVLPPKADLYLYVANAQTGLTGADISALEQLYLLSRPTALIFSGPNCRSPMDTLCQADRDLGGLVSATVGIDPNDQTEVDSRIAELVLRSLPSRLMVVARSIESTRARAAKSLVLETSRVNGEFALLSNLPANIPVLGTILSAGADFVLLTKNQAMMVLKLAAIYGRPMDDRWRLAAEIAPVVGAAFGWRTISRLLVGTLPTPVAALPKTAIAYAGTYVIGQMAQYYYQHGRRPSRATTRRFAEEAAAQWRGALAASAS